MNPIKSLLDYLNESAQILHDFHCGSDELPKIPDPRVVCNHCFQRVNDPNIDHASTGCTVKVSRD